MPALNNIGIASTFTIGNGNDPTLKAMASFQVVQIKKILKNNEFLASIRSSLTAKSINQYGDFATGIYPLPNRLVAGTDWDFENGPILNKKASIKYASVRMDQIMSAGIVWESFDIERWSVSNPAEKYAYVSEWMGSLFDSILMSYEAVFWRGLKDFGVANYLNRPENLFVVDPAKIKSPEQARDVYNLVGAQLLRLKKIIDENTVGTNIADYRLYLSAELILALTTYLGQFVFNSESSTPLATGRLWKTSMWGKEVQEVLALNTHFEKGTETQINKDIDLDLRGVHLALIHDDAIAMPSGWSQSINLIDNKTGNPKYLFRGLGALPCVLREKLFLLGVEKLPEKTDVSKAQGMVWDPNLNNYQKSFQLSGYGKPFIKA